MQNNTDEDFMFKYFPNMFKNKKNFYVHIKKKKERRRNESIYSAKSKMDINPCIGIKNLYLARIENDPVRMDLRLNYKQTWDSSVLDDEYGKYLLI